MSIDPVVLLAEELRGAATALRTATQIYRRDSRQQNGKTVKELLVTIKSLYSDLAETMPTSALGAGELVRLVAQLLPSPLAQYASHFNQVAARLCEGKRTQSDLVWLRAMQAALSGCGEDGNKAALLLRLAIAGAARPVMVFRAVLPAQAGRGQDWCDILSDPEGWESKRRS
jgi:translation initiation factor 2B subunit (eIF-2B alpha/beta/delta family)